MIKLVKGQLWISKTNPGKGFCVDKILKTYDRFNNLTRHVQYWDHSSYYSSQVADYDMMLSRIERYKLELSEINTGDLVMITLEGSDYYGQIHPVHNVDTKRPLYPYVLRFTGKWGNIITPSYKPGSLELVFTL